MNYAELLDRKRQLGSMDGFDPVWMPSFLFDFQQSLVEWALRKGRAAIFADCGLGKGPMQLVFAENVATKTGKPFLILAPLAVAQQFEREGEKFGIPCERSRGGPPKAQITVANYERLHLFSPDDFGGVSCDESSIIKHFSGATQRGVTEFLRKMPYRLMCSATPAPNDFIELGTTAEALGEMGRMDMLGTFFKNDENSLHPIWWGARWRFKKHAERDFWRWVSSWARALRSPTDLGFPADGFDLPPLLENEHVIGLSRPLDGMLFMLPAISLHEQRSERRVTLEDRCEEVSRLVNSHAPAVVWCHLNDEADLLERAIPDAKQVAGRHDDDEKEETFRAFAEGRLRVLITKPRIGGFGMNWQHCSHMTFFPSHSFEQYYQGVRRCWRFGQQLPVTVDIVTTEGEVGVLRNIQRKAAAAETMFSQCVIYMNDALMLRDQGEFSNPMEAPSWL